MPPSCQTSVGRKTSCYQHVDLRQVSSSTAVGMSMALLDVELQGFTRLSKVSVFLLINEASLPRLADEIVHKGLARYLTHLKSIFSSGTHDGLAKVNLGHLSVLPHLQELCLMFTAYRCAKCFVLHSFAALSHIVQSVTGILGDSA